MANKKISEFTDGGIALTTDSIAAVRGGVNTKIVLPPGQIIQRVSTVTGAVATGTTVIPYDDSIPQKTEGDSYMTQAITAKATGNILVVDVYAIVSPSLVDTVILALFQDSANSAVAATCVDVSTATNGIVGISLRYIGAAGTVSATTFSVRIGKATAGTITFNGIASGRKLGGKLASSIMIAEYAL